LNVYILDQLSNELVIAEITSAKEIKMPLKKDRWNFNWNKLVKDQNSETYLLRRAQNIEGLMHLKVENEMMFMDVLEIAPHNIGSQNKIFDFVAGCLIAFACRESFKLTSEYKGFLTFVSKTKLIPWYSKKYGAEQALGQRMFINPQNGLKLIEEYLNRNR